MVQQTPGNGLPRPRSDVLLAAGVVGIVGMMVLPLPTALLDVLLALNIALSVLLLLVATQISDPLRLSTLPTLLLITTLFRLGLNVSSTRLILLQADAGRVIESFGRFVAGSDLLVGAVMFLILTLIQYVVIARGSERVAEVAARFTLDALPGRQMAIDSDLRSGAVSRAEARRLRGALGRESQLFGAMDGAMKFIKGDAIAGICITVVNIGAGLAIGVLQRGLEPGRAAAVYGVLTIGDGLVSQIPALLLATAAGVVVTRVSSEGDERLGAQLGRQLLAHPRALGLLAGLLALLALLPGLPAVPFLLLAVLAGGGSRVLLRRRERALRLARERRSPLSGTAPQPPVLVVELGEALAACADPGTTEGWRAEELLRRLRQLVFEELGLPLSQPVLRACAELAPRGYRVRLHGEPVARGEMPAGALVLGDEAALRARGVRSPARHLPVVQPPLFEVGAEDAGRLGEDVERVDAPTLLSLHLGVLVRAHAGDLLGMQETQDLLDGLAETHPAVVQELLSGGAPLGRTSRVLAMLLQEGVAIRDVRAVAEVLAAAPREAGAEEVLEGARRRLGRSVCAPHLGAAGELRALELDPLLDQALRDGLQVDRAGRAGRQVPPALARDVVAAVRGALARAGDAAEGVVLLSRAELRRPLRALIRAELPDLAVLAHEELPDGVTVRALGRVEPC